MNKAKENRNLVVGLDIGTSKIVAIVAEVLPEGGFEVIGLISKRLSMQSNEPWKKLNSWLIVKLMKRLLALQAVTSKDLIPMAWFRSKTRKSLKKTWNASWKLPKLSIFPRISRFCTF